MSGRSAWSIQHKLNQFRHFHTLNVPEVLKSRILFEQWLSEGRDSIKIGSLVAVINIRVKTVYFFISFIYLYTVSVLIDIIYECTKLVCLKYPLAFAKLKLKYVFKIIDFRRNMYIYICTRSLVTDPSSTKFINGI